MTSLRFLSLAVAACFVGGATLVACVGDTARVPTEDAGVDAGLDVASDVDAGACGTPGLGCCAGATCGGGAICTSAKCTCAAPKTACGPSCSDLSLDPKNCGACGHDCLGGDCTDGVCQPVTILSGQANVTRIVPSASKLYWSRAKTNLQSAGVFMAGLDGRSPTSIVGSSGSCGAIATSATHVYFTCDGLISRCEIGPCQSGPTPLLTQANVSAMAFDGANDRLYFTVATNRNSQIGGFVGSIPAAGGAVARLAANDQPSPSALLIDNGTVYWLNAGTYVSDTPQQNGGVKRAPLGENQSVNIIATDPSGADYSSLALLGKNVYWTGNFFSGSTIHDAATIGGSFGDYVATVQPGGARAVIADAKYVYWIENAGNVYRCEPQCNTPTLLAAAPGPLALAQDDKAVYWSTSLAEIRRIAK